MNEQEAIAIITNMIPKKCKMVNGRLRGGYDDWDSEEGKAIRIAIDIFEEIQHYRAIGNVEECREAREKQRVRKPIKYEPYAGKCKCGAKVFADKGYCAICGQAIDWGDTHETHT